MGRKVTTKLLRILRGAGLVRAAMLAAALLASATAGAQTLPEAIDFNESFVGASISIAPSTGGALFAPGPQASPAPAPQSAVFASQLIVGIAYGASAAPVDLAALSILAPAGGDGESICVSLSTVDGRYSADSAHPVGADLAGPAALGLTTRYATELAGYRAADLLVRAVRAPDCLGEPSGAIAPALLQDAAEALLVSISLGRGRPRAWIEQAGDRLGSAARCEPASSAARTHICEVDVAGLAPGDYTLVVFARRPGAEPIERRVALALP